MDQTARMTPARKRFVQMVNQSGMMDECANSMGIGDESAPRAGGDMHESYEIQLQRVLCARSCRVQNRRAHARARKALREGEGGLEWRNVMQTDVDALRRQPAVFWFGLRLEAMSEEELRALLHRTDLAMSRYGRGCVPQAMRERLAMHFDRLCMSGEPASLPGRVSTWRRQWFTYVTGLLTRRRAR